MKAQLYKMTLYVCDLGNSLTLDEIKTLIMQDALDGVAVSCVCHFADCHIGKQVEWDDDIDLNECGCPTSVWDKYFTTPKKPKTNADSIRATDDELATMLHAVKMGYKPWCDYHCENEGDDGCDNCIKEWLQQPAEGE